jgi:hypothetical protein
MHQQKLRTEQTDHDGADVSFERLAVRMVLKTSLTIDFQKRLNSTIILYAGFVDSSKQGASRRLGIRSAWSVKRTLLVASSERHQGHGTAENPSTSNCFQETSAAGQASSGRTVKQTLQKVLQLAPSWM